MCDEENNIYQLNSQCVESLKYLVSGLYNVIATYKSKYSALLRQSTTVKDSQGLIDSGEEARRSLIEDLGKLTQIQLELELMARKLEDQNYKSGHA